MLVCFAPKSEPQEIPVTRKDGYVEVCVLEIYRDKPVLGSDLWHDLSHVNILNLQPFSIVCRTQRDIFGRSFHAVKFLLEVPASRDWFLDLYVVVQSE